MLLVEMLLVALLLRRVVAVLLRMVGSMRLAMLLRMAVAVLLASWDPSVGSSYYNLS